ncbi:MAG: LamG domain-containing protein [Dysgonamonadaceae bacterium]|jgi:hypothetical protein|nr:LamG domain-containing protein [Dysgonamonadaceae bacterium]
MKRAYFYLLIALVTAALGLQSCFQDLDQDPPYNYPEMAKPTYEAKYDGEIFYLPFEDNYAEQFTLDEPAVVGTPDFQAGKIGKAYKGAADSYLSFFPKGLSQSFSAAFWYKLNATPDRGGILCISPDDPAAAAAAKNNRTKGFRFFREPGNGGQTFKLNVGNGTADSWFDGGANAMLNPETTGSGWVFMAFTISKTECIVYINGEIVSQGSISGGISWEGCENISIGSGAPYFTEWGHLADASLIDELRLFNKTLSQQEIRVIMNAAQ